MSRTKRLILRSADHFHGVADHHLFACVRRRAGVWEVDCGWRVYEAHDDDYMSHTYQPLTGGPAPWVGRRLVVDTLDEAATAFDEALDAVTARRVTALLGDHIGSVSR